MGFQDGNLAERLGPGRILATLKPRMEDRSRDVQVERRSLILSWSGSIDALKLSMVE